MWEEPPVNIALTFRPIPEPPGIVANVSGWREAFSFLCLPLQGQYMCPCRPTLKVGYPLVKSVTRCCYCPRFCHVVKLWLPRGQRIWMDLGCVDSATQRRYETPWWSCDVTDPYGFFKRRKKDIIMLHCHGDLSFHE